MAFIFVPLLALTMVVSFFVWVYLAHSFVLVIEETAAGNDEVVWPDEPLYDWIWKGGYLLWVVGVWVMPAVLAARLATRGLNIDLQVARWSISPEEQRWSATILVASVVFWLFFPLSLLSTMSAESRWAVLHGPLFQRLGRNLASLLVFYLISGVLVVVCAPLILALVFGDDVFTLILGGVGVSAAALLIARLLGRLANRARLTYIRPRTKNNKPKIPAEVRKRVRVSDPWEAAEDAPELPEPPEPPPPQFVQPSDLPALHTPYEGDIVGYDVRFEDVPKRETPARRTRKRDEPMPVKQDEEAEEQRQTRDKSARERAIEAIRPDKIELDRLTRKREMPADTAITRGVAMFLIQRTVSVQWLTLALGISFLGLLIRGLQAFWPV